MFKIDFKKLLDGTVPKFELMARLIFYGLMLFISATFIWFLLFLYQKFYITLAQTEEIVVLKSQLAVDVLDIEIFQKIKDAQEARQNLPLVEWGKVNNPFGRSAKTQ